jgi:DNA-binding CsgD family transcriptional regulator
MRLLGRRDEERLAEVEALLSSYSLTSNSLRAAFEAVAALLGSDQFAIYQPAPRSDVDALRLEWGYEASPHPVTARLNGWLADKGVKYGGFNALRPEPRQRNRLLSGGEVVAMTGSVSRVESEFYPLIGARGHHTLRVLICERASLLAYMCILQSAAETPVQRAVMHRLMTPLQRRLMFERRLRESDLASAAIETALDQIAAPAWLLKRNGSVAVTNSAGRARLATKRSLAADLRVPTSDPAFRRIPVTARGEIRGHLVVERGEAPERTSRVAAFASRARLTPAQTRVLQLLACGHSNTTIAAQLAVALRTVETHMTAIFEKTQTFTRAGLLAEIMSAPIV